MEDIINACGQLQDSTIEGLMGLLAISLREQTNLSYQFKEYGFADIPRDIINMIDDLGNKDYLSLTSQLSIALLDKI